ncbi:MAG: MBL fold metallo-hydrolase [Anaerorhabdus sp.]
MDLKGNTTITFHSGILTIGGTVIEIEYNGSRVFFDFGTEFRPELKLKDENLETLIEHKLIPDIDIYDKRFKRIVNSKDTAVFLSHCHLDHTRMINYLDSDIPLYALSETKSIIELLNKDRKFILPSFDPNIVTRDIIGLKPEEVIKVGEIEVMLYRVDHDAYGACGMIIKTNDITIGYTGDLRLHGFDSKDTAHFCEKAYNCDILLMEGVSISFDENNEKSSNKFESEEKLVEWIVNEVDKNPDKQITFNAYLANVKRFERLISDVNRKVVVSEKMAYILKEILHLDCFYQKDDNIDWKMDKKFAVDISELENNPQKYLWQIDDYQSYLQKGGLYLHCDASPLGLFDPYYLVFKEKFESNQIEFKHIGCSGHATPNDLDRIVEMIKPKCLIPIHSLHPERLKNPYGEVHLPKRGEKLKEEKRKC